MPVIVVGADTPLGEATMDALLPRPSEVRAFVSSPEAAANLRGRGVKVALGDISDGSHVGGAALNSFCAVLIAEAAADDRERSFAADPPAVIAAWVEGLNDAGISRAILVAPQRYPNEMGLLNAEAAYVSTAQLATNEVVEQILALEDAATLG